ncbi:MAG: recombinase family protein [Ruminococcus sp.]|nr:recombinase family protein [Ruminococcus sp.]
MEKGVVLGCGRIYGYKVIGGKLEIVPEEAEIVKDIFHMYLYEGKGSTAIAHELDERGIPTLKNRVWSGQHVLKILNNEKYVGDLTQWKVYKPNVLAEKTFINHGENPDAPLITVKNHHEPIVSREVFDAVQEERKRRGWLTREGKKHSNNFWLSGKMVCGKCGYSFIMSRTSKNSSASLRCRNRALYGKENHTAINGELLGCDAHTVDERIVAAAMKNILGQINEFRPVLEKQMIEEIQNIQLVQKDVDIAPLKQEISKLENKKHKAIDLMLDELISKEDLKKQTEIYDKEIARLTEEIARNQDISARQNTQMAEIKKTVEYMQKLSDCNSESKELYRSLLKQIVVPDYGVLNIFLNGVPFGFDIRYTTLKAPRKGIYDIIINSCEIIF